MLCIADVISGVIFDCCEEACLCVLPQCQRLVSQGRLLPMTRLSIELDNIFSKAGMLSGCCEYAILSKPVRNGAVAGIR